MPQDRLHAEPAVVALSGDRVVQLEEVDALGLKPLETRLERAADLGFQVVGRRRIDPDLGGKVRGWVEPRQQAAKRQPIRPGYQLS
jgi:hypothetical protein